MNQVASANGRPPAGSTATASCCPVFSPFFMNTFTPQAQLIPPPSAQQCFLGTQTNQIQPITSIQPPATNQQQLNAGSQQQQPTVSQQSAVSAQQDRTHQSQGARDHSSQSTNLSNSNYGTSLTAQTLSLQHLLANRQIPAPNYVALAAAAALAAGFPHFQQLHPSHQIHHQSSTSNATNTNDTTTINQATTNNTSVTTNDSVNPLPSSNMNTPAATISNQVPLNFPVNFNSYSNAPQNLNLSASNAPLPPPVAAHLNNSNVNQQQSNLSRTSQISTEVDGQNRHISTNTLLNNVENEQQISTAYRRVPAGQTVRQQPQPLSAPAPPPAQHMPQVSRAPLNEEANNLSEQIRATMILNFIASNPFAATLGQVPLPQQHTTQPQINSARSHFSLPNHVPIAPTQQMPAPFISQPRLEQVSSSQRQSQQLSQQPQVTSQPTNRSAQPPIAPDSVRAHTGGIYQQQQHATNSTIVGHQQPQAHSDQNVQAQPQQSVPPTQQQQQQQQSQTTLPAMPFYAMPQLEQALAFMSDPQLLSQIFNLYYQSNGPRPEQHTHHNPPHHFHPHLHGSHHHHHHHHHHGANGQGNGQDSNLPVDSLAISESKPKGLNRAEIDSLTHYIHTDEKDSRSCVICLSKFELKSKIRPLSCNHAFHAKCVDKWLRANRTCPICRRDALKTYEGKIKRI